MRIPNTKYFLLCMTSIAILLSILPMTSRTSKRSRGKFVPPIPYQLPRTADHVYTSLAARRLPKSGQVFCWVQTSSIYHDTRVLAINETWLPRCDHGEFFTDRKFASENIAYSTVFAEFPDSYWTLFYKTRYAFYYIYNYVSKDFEWYLRADDDAYIVMEHLSSYLSTLDSNEPYYLGYVLKHRVEHGYNTGGSGYVLSRKALQIYNDFLYHNETLCPNSLAEDQMMARCLANVGIFPHDTRNSYGQNRFNAFTPYDVFYATHYHPNWTYFPEKRGYEGFAADFISFHHLKPDEIRLFDILLYRTNRSIKPTVMS